MNDANNKSSALFTPSGCLTGDALMLFVSGSLKGSSLAKAQKHITDCPLCADAADGLRMWLKENQPDQASSAASISDSESSEFTGKHPAVFSRKPKTNGSNTSLFLERTDVINERIRQRLHTHALIEATENKRLSYKPFIWMAAAATIILFIGGFYVVWVQNQWDQERLAKVRANEMLLLENPANPDTLIVSLPENKTVLAISQNQNKGTFKPVPNLVNGINADADVFNQDDLSTVSEVAALPETRQMEEPADKKEDAKASEVYRNNTTSVNKSAGTAAKKAEIEQEGKSLFTIVEEMPSFPGGETERNKFFVKNIVYPQQAAENGIQGTVYVSFVVNTRGIIEDIKILRGIGGGCDEEALRVMKLMPRWKPGRQNGKKVDVLYNMPVYFKLQ